MSFWTNKKDLELDRGNDRDYALRVRRPFANPLEERAPNYVDLTGCLLVFTLKRKAALGKSVHTDPWVVRKTSEDSAEIMVPSQATPENLGRAYVYLEAEDTEFLEPGPYVYDIKVTTPEGRRYTVAKGQFTIIGDVGSSEDRTSP